MPSSGQLKLDNYYLAVANAVSVNYILLSNLQLPTETNRWVLVPYICDTKAKLVGVGAEFGK